MSKQKYICTQAFKIKGDQVYEIDLKQAFPDRDITKIWIAREGSNRVKVCVAAPEELNESEVKSE